MRAISFAFIAAARGQSHVTDSDAASTIDSERPGDMRSDAAQAPPLRLAGINLPPTQGTSDAGAFLPGIYELAYTPQQVAAMGSAFTALRVPINSASAADPSTLAKLRGSSIASAMAATLGNAVCRALGRCYFGDVRRRRSAAIAALLRPQ